MAGKKIRAVTCWQPGGLCGNLPLPWVFMSLPSNTSFGAALLCSPGSDLCRDCKVVRKNCGAALLFTGVVRASGPHRPITSPRDQVVKKRDGHMQKILEWKSGNCRCNSTQIFQGAVGMDPSAPEQWPAKTHHASFPGDYDHLYNSLNPALHYVF